MYRLQLKFAPIAFAALLIFAAVTAIFPGVKMFQGTYHFHLAVLILIQLGVSIIAAFVLFDRGSIVQKYKVAVSVFALSSIYGIVGNIACYSWTINPGGDLVFSTAQIVLMNLGGVLTALTLYKLEPIDSFSDGGLDRLKGKTDTATAEGPGTSVNKMRGIETASAEAKIDSVAAAASLDVKAPEAEAKAAAEPEKKTPYTSPPQVEIDLEASDEMLSGPLNPNPQASQTRMEAQPGAAQEPSSTGNRMQAARRRNTSTFTKLQALSASGTGSVTAAPPEESEGSGDLKSLLDRLDTDEQDEAPAATPAARAEAPQAQPQTRTEVKPQAQSQAVKEKIGPPIEVRADYLFDDLDKLTDKSAIRVTTGYKEDTPVAPVKEEIKAEPVKEEIKPEPVKEEIKPEPVKEEIKPEAAAPNLENLLDREDIQPEEAAKTEEPEAAVTEKVEGSALEESTSNLLSQRFMEMTDEEEEKVEEPAPAAAPEAKVEEPAKAEAKADDGEKVFGESVDSEIDDLFTTLAPEEAQKEVGEIKLQKEEVAEELPEQARAEEATREEVVVEDKAPEEAPKEEEAGDKLFNKDVDSDIDDIFTSLAPEEAQKEVGAVKAEKPEAAEPETKEEEEGGIFKLGDDDVDDIFAGLTADDQKNVDQETLKEVKEKTKVDEPAEKVEVKAKEKVAEASPRSTGDMPALKPEQAQKIREQASKPGKFSDTLSKIPSLKNTVEGLLQSLEEEQGPEDEVEEEAAPVSDEALSSEQKAARDAANKLKDFGRLSSKAVAKPAADAPENQGTMKTIGKLLIDKQAVEKIIKSGEAKELGKGLSNARIISAARGKGISDLLTKIDEYEGVVGSIVVGHDGLVMASTLRDGWDKDMMGALSTALLSTSNLTTKKLEIGKLRQMVMLTTDGGQSKTTVLTDVDVGILAVFVDETDVTKIDGLLNTIQETIHG